MYRPNPVIASGSLRRRPTALPACPQVLRRGARPPRRVFLAKPGPKRYPASPSGYGADMSIDKQSDIAANLQIGPTSLGMVRIYVEADGVDLPLDFEPEEALEIAEELRAAAERARAMARSDAPKAPGPASRG